MKQILQSLKSGQTEVANLPAPAVSGKQVLIQTTKSLISAGTEKMLVEFGKANLIDKARQQPDKVRMVLDKIKTDGLQPAIEAVFNKLDQPLALGYCNVGRILAVGAGVHGLETGMRVVSNGKHAEIVSVPMNLCAKVPDAVSDEEASFTVLSAIALQGIRLVAPTLGETVVVTGLGLVGLLTVQLLRAHGCRVLGIDLDPSRLSLARKFGAQTVDLSAGQDPVSAADAYSKGKGVDAVIVCASTKSSEPIHQAAQMCRKRGRIVLVGVAGLELSRDDFFQKELTFQVSASYGPGRYDPNYEEKGNDYPFGFVRWTEQRNFEAVLDMMADGRLDLKPLISHRFPIAEAENAYILIGGSEQSLGIVLDYPGLGYSLDARTVSLYGESVQLPSSSRMHEYVQISFIGAGNYATAVLMKAFRAAGCGFRSVVSKAGVSGLYAGRKFHFHETTTDSDRIFHDENTDAVVITTRHNSHAQYVLKALKARKHVYVEKPLCLTLAELEEIKISCSENLSQSSRLILMVGFNRRFSPHIQKIKSLLSGVDCPKSFIMTVNAGAIPSDHWTQDINVGGGRVIGEACHFIDLLRYLAACPIVEWSKTSMNGSTDDTVSILLKFSDGSTGAIHYFANGSKSFPKERLEVFCGGRILQLDNYRRLKGFGWPAFKRMSSWRQDKGQFQCAKAFINAIERGEASPIPQDEILEVARISIEMAEAEAFES